MSGGSGVADINDYVRADGSICIPDGMALTSFFEGNQKAYGDLPAYRFVDYAKERDGSYVDLTWSGLWDRVRAIGARLQQVTQPGDRVAICAPQGVEYVAGFFAAVHAGRIAVPLFAPALAGHAERLTAVLADAQPTAILTTTAAAETARRFVRTLPAAGQPRLIAVDAIPDTLAASFTDPVIGTDDIAYLQYTSGSTRIPAGVEITHRSACTNVLQMILGDGLDRGIRSVSWLPLYHDMGLVMLMFPALCGGYLVLMDPMAFVRRPYRWIKQLSVEAAHGRTFAAAPNFAFELTAERGLPPEGDDIDLTNVVGLLNGSEPVTIAAIEKFTAAFAPYGLPANAVKPSYGMAEATLGAATTRPEDAPRCIYLDRAELTSTGRARLVSPDADGAVAYVSCGRPFPEVWAVVVDGDGAELPDGTVGEIWLHGDNVGKGYFRREEETQRTFGNKLQSRVDPESHAEGVADNSCWLATGDLGFYLDGDLFLTGRIKDLVIIDGRNHYPHDIEVTVGDSSPSIRTGYVAAFSVPAAELETPIGTGEQLIVIAERAAGAGRVDAEATAAAVRAAIAREHHIRVADVRLVAAGSIPRTTSGKLARRACRAEYLAGQYDR